MAARAAEAASRRREEIANSLSHGVGLLAALAAAPVLVVTASRRGDAMDIVAHSVFAATLVLLYLASTWYHATAAGRLRDRLRRLDHAAIFVVIAGTYTPFTLGILRGGWGWSIFGVVWAAAAIGVCTKLIGGVRSARISTVLYLVMGWFIVIAAGPLVRTMPMAGIQWLVLGGVLYTAGVGFFAAHRVPYAHFVWHLFVLGGSACHVLAVLNYAVA